MLREQVRMKFFEHLNDFRILGNLLSTRKWMNVVNVKAGMTVVLFCFFLLIELILDQMDLSLDVLNHQILAESRIYLENEIFPQCTKSKKSISDD